jgi:CRISPR/Cas system-associated exonuclease Cas4 (RecB family)
MMTATMTLDQLIASLTLEQAIECGKQTDILMWIEVNLLDPVNISRRKAEAVEEALDEIYCNYLDDERTARIDADIRSNLMRDDA